MIKNLFKKKNKDDSQPGVVFFFDRYQVKLNLIRQEWFEDNDLWEKTVEEIRKILGAIIKSETKFVHYDSYDEGGHYNGQAKKLETVETGKLKDSFASEMRARQEEFKKTVAVYDDIKQDINDIIAKHPHSDIVWQKGGEYEVRYRNSPENVRAFITNSGGAGNTASASPIDDYYKNFENWRKNQINKEQKEITKLRKEKADIIAGLLINSRNVINGEVVECGYTAHSYIVDHNGVNCLDIRISKNNRSLKISVPFINGRDQTEFVKNKIAECIYQIELGLERDNKQSKTLDEFVYKVLEDD